MPKRPFILYEFKSQQYLGNFASVENALARILQRPYTRNLLNCGIILAIKTKNGPLYATIDQRRTIPSLANRWSDMPIIHITQELPWR